MARLATPNEDAAGPAVVPKLDCQDRLFPRLDDRMEFVKGTDMTIAETSGPSTTCR